ncbi:hypothetical protein NC661_03615 [Aquibacillus koreensis]|uniref:Uncharacterized protein n=1 Tax=Aquibacillus koreensis TaxID=279446 RepID=A0A9X3WGR2_9BACI|nr:hypothetical protein [Aquibacillus koreensis]MCT2536462.1 hypothetical protein [Aquibacillus koreensis]MDC3419450.1 hypothetical protein [Aquibacillus koreensis]
MSHNKSGRLVRWREKYGAIAVAISCICSAIVSWGNNWILTGILVLGVFFCGLIGIFDIKRANQKRK